MEHIKPLDIHYDHKKLLEVKDAFHRAFPEFTSHHIHISSKDGVTYKPEWKYKEGEQKGEQNNLRMGGGLEQDKWNKLNEFFKGTYLEEVYNDLDDKFNICRGRYMTTDQDRRAYSYHVDLTPRLHIPLKTNEDNIFLVEDVLYKMQDLGRVYWMDTTKKHTAANFSWEERHHLVFMITMKSWMKEQMNATST